MRISHFVAAAALIAVPACKKKDADQPAPAADNPPAQTGSNAPTPTAKAVEPKPAEAPKPKTGKELADLYMQCGDMLNAAKFDDFTSQCIDANAVSHRGGMPEMKAADLKQHFADMHAAFPDMKAAPQLVLVNGRTIFAVGLMTGTHEGPLKMPGMPDVPATHKKVGFFMAHKLAFNDANKVTEEWNFMDPGTMMFQLGLAPKDAPPHRAATDKGLEGAPIVAVAADDAKEKANLDVAKKQNDGFNAHKPADVLATMTDDAVESDMVADKDHKGKKEIEKGLKDFLTAFSDAKVNADLAAAGDFVYSTGTFEGTNDHDMGKMKKTGKHVAVPYAEIFQVKDGKISHLWRFYSSMDFAMQLGMMKAPGEAGAPPAPGATPADKGADKGKADKAAPKGDAKGDAKKADKK